MPSTNIAATTAAVANRFVTTTNMKVGAYTVANASPVWQGGCLVTVTHTVVTVTADTLGTIAIVGTDLNGQTISETITPLSGTIATGTKVFRTVTSVTGAGWVIDGVEGVEDTIVVGCAAGSLAASTSGYVDSIFVGATAAATVVLSDKRGTLATLKASIAEGSYRLGFEYYGFLKIATTSTNDVTVTHSASVPPYATA